MHHVVTAADRRPAEPYPANATGFRSARLVGREEGATHTAFSHCTLASRGRIDTHVHSFEEIFYVTEGTPTLVLDGRGILLSPGTAGVIPVGQAHAWIGAEEGSAVWLELQTPIPRARTEPADTFFLGAPAVRESAPADIRDPRTFNLFRATDDDIDVDKLKVGARLDAPTVSSSMATALLAYSGIAVKMLVDQRMGAAMGSMFLVDYQPGGVAHPHDHPLEEAYFILEGEVEAVADGQTHVLKPGDALWTGVGCIHAFYNRTGKRVRWLETQAPLPPVRHSYRFSRDWDYLAGKLTSSVPAIP